MGIEFYYEGPAGQGHIGECGFSTWHVAKEIVPLLFDFVNYTIESPSKSDWPSSFRLALFSPDHLELRTFDYRAILEDRSGISEIVVLDADEILRFFEWWDYLFCHPDSGERWPRAGTGGLYLFEPLVESLKTWVGGVDKFGKHRPGNTR